MVSETCACGATFSAERSDELKLLNQWRTSHKCPSNDSAGLVMIDNSRNELAPDYMIPELHIGFRGNDEEDD